MLSVSPDIDDFGEFGDKKLRRLETLYFHFAVRYMIIITANEPGVEK